MPSLPVSGSSMDFEMFHKPTVPLEDEVAKSDG
eukprot:CAMPEP_0198153114 /NCGR_PEP_ID=MMETSP1443-20131203/62751_1 /TAXON_ID=186043 /ORGANISM="Entomoneis sp., Strain CCMP2396" /LENGTH=32 /DNA_ID= /DNA_START= /DNA_END= /DNA_ORIENTATION=